MQRLKRYLLFVLVLLIIGSLVTYSVEPTRTTKVQNSNSSCPYLFISWNGRDVGQSKSADDIAHMAKIVHEADIIALQEIVAGKGFGAKTVAALAAELSKDGSSWDYIVSDPTQPPSPGVERYAYLIRSTVSFQRRSATLHAEVAATIDREPYSLLAIFGIGTTIEFFSFHAVPEGKQPEREVASLTTMPDLMSGQRVIVAGDFNLNRKVTDPLFTPHGYTGHITQETSLKEMVTPTGDYLSHQYDNIYTKGIDVCESGVIDFVTQDVSPVSTRTLTAARQVSDHLPVYIRFK